MIENTTFFDSHYVYICRMQTIHVNKNIALSPIVATDSEALMFHINDITIFENSLNIPYPYIKEDAARFIKFCNDQNIRYSTINNMAIRICDTGEMIGCIGAFFKYGDESHKDEVGYWLSKQHRGKGIMMPVLQSYCDYLYQSRPTLMRIEAGIFSRQYSFGKSAVKSGFRIRRYYAQRSTKRKRVTRYQMVFVNSRAQ
ncbi:MAG: GNAT family N-acetyltransferase [Bacteroidetes bacterium]|nr:GNAT family N-acetyltransferase [Bacteroidota bacterium]